MLKLKVNCFELSQFLSSSALMECNLNYLSYPGFNSTELGSQLMIRYSWGCFCLSTNWRSAIFSEMFLIMKVLVYWCLETTRPSVGFSGIICKKVFFPMYRYYFGPLMAPYPFNSMMFNGNLKTFSPSFFACNFSSTVFVDPAWTKTFEGPIISVSSRWRSKLQL